MTPLSLWATTLDIPFVEAFKHASAERAATQTFWVTAARGGVTGHGEGCPREYVTAESIGTAHAFFARHCDEWMPHVGDLAALRAWVDAHAAEIDANPAAWCAVELALLDLFAREKGEGVEPMLGVAAPSGTFRYTAVLGDASPSAFAAQLARYRQAGFTAFKIKLSGERECDAAKVAALRAAGIDGSAVRADANNLWRDAATVIAHLRSFEYPFMAIEEPLVAGDHAGLAMLADALGSRIVLDESLLRTSQLAQFSDRSGRWIANLRVSKMGGVLRSLALVEALRDGGIGLIVGAHVGETSLLTRAALAVAANARDMLLAQEGAFGTLLLSHDVTTTPLMFGAGGGLGADTWGFSRRPGWGLEVVIPAGR